MLYEVATNYGILSEGKHDHEEYPFLCLMRSIPASLKQIISNLL
jgi:hypothetical protein